MPPQTIIRDGSGSQQVVYALPPGVFQYVQSVLVEVDNTAGGDVRPTLQVQTVNGVVMAAKRQGETIPAGDTGTATWALRLDDEGAGGSASGGDVALLWEFFVPAGGQAVVDTNVDGSQAGLLSQAYSVLEVFAAARSDIAGINAGCGIHFNGDSGNNYDFEFSQVQSNPPATALANSYNQSGLSFAIPGATAPASRPSSLAMVIPAYASTLLHKTGTFQSRQPGGAAFAGAASTLLQEGFNWHPAAVAGIDRVAFNATAGSKFVEGSFFAVYGRT